jgi:hypothetical protein
MTLLACSDIPLVGKVNGIIASIFAVSRMLDMMTEMELVPHRYFHMPGSIQKHTLVYTIVLGLLLTAFFDLSRIAALGIIRIACICDIPGIVCNGFSNYNISRRFYCSGD